ncbi:hypothetical protein MFRU_011g02170 [Monilinia fructicola]|nr:hypothetical protein MFRU_011g02170 [Monilinia fructicola]
MSNHTETPIPQIPTQDPEPSKPSDPYLQDLDLRDHQELSSELLIGLTISCEDLRKRMMDDFVDLLLDAMIMGVELDELWVYKPF